MSSNGLRVGITINQGSPDESLWVNGIKQNALYLAEALRHVPSVRSVQLVNLTQARTTQASWDLARWPLVGFMDVKDNLDVLIELGSAVGHQGTEYIKQRGTRLVSYCCGVEYVMAMQAMLFNRVLWGDQLQVNQRYDGIWVIPQVAPTSLHFFQTLRRRDADVVPFVWDPVLLRERSSGLAHNGEYHPRPGPRRVSIMEPNVDVVKFCLYPALIVEEAYRRSPDAIAMMQITNTGHLANRNPEFTVLMQQLDVVRNRKAVFLDRHETPQFLSENTDVMVSHQWGNPLNYFYFDVCWQGYPLVHNADLCPELGYYYPGNDVPAGCEQLLVALSHHDGIWEAYRDEQRRHLSRYLPGERGITTRYAALLADLMRRPLA
jgi:hypothetical protein